MVMKKVNRLVLSGLLALSVTGGSLAPFVASHASADVPRGTCHANNEDCGVSRDAN